MERVKNGERLWAIKLPPLFRKEEAEGDLAIPIYLKLISPNPSLRKRGFFYDMAFSGFIGNVFERVKNGERLWAIAPPSFVKRGPGEIL